MKKVIVTVVLLFLVLTGCATEKNDKLSIVTTTFPQYDFARQIAGDKADVTMLIPVGSDLHSFEPGPKDIMKINTCDVFIYVGGESDVWIEEILNSLENNKVKIIKLMDVITDNNEIHNHMHEYDEHIWTTPANAIKIVNKISETMQNIDEKNAQFYKVNANDYVKVLRSADLSFKKIISEGKRNLFVFADRYPLKHFSDEYNLSYISPFSGCNDETEPSIESVKEIIDAVNENKIPVVFYTEMSNQKMADVICEATGAKKMKFNTYHNVTKKEFDEGITYNDLMKHNIYALREALN